MGVEISKIRQVKVPVTDLARSVRWYMALLGLELGVEFFERGGVRGVVLLDRDDGYVIALRDREFCASCSPLRGSTCSPLALPRRRSCTSSSSAASGSASSTGPLKTESRPACAGHR